MAVNQGPRLDLSRALCRWSDCLIEIKLLDQRRRFASPNGSSCSEEEFAVIAMTEINVAKVWIDPFPARLQELHKMVGAGVWRIRPETRSSNQNRNRWDTYDGSGDTRMAFTSR